MLALGSSVYAGPALTVAASTPETDGATTTTVAPAERASEPFSKDRILVKFASTATSAEVDQANADAGGKALTHMEGLDLYVVGVADPEKDVERYRSDPGSSTPSWTTSDMARSSPATRLWTIPPLWSGRRGR